MGRGSQFINCKIVLIGGRSSGTLPWIFRQPARRSRHVRRQVLHLRPALRVHRRPKGPRSSLRLRPGAHVGVRRRRGHRRRDRRTPARRGPEENAAFPINPRHRKVWVSGISFLTKKSVEWDIASWPTKRRIIVMNSTADRWCIQ